MKLHLYGFRLIPDQPAAYSRYRAALGTLSTLFDANFCFGGGLQKVGGNGMSLTLMWCGGAVQSIGGCQTIAFHTDGGCGDSRNQVKNAAVVRLPTRIREEEEKWSRKRFCVG